MSDSLDQAVEPAVPEPGATDSPSPPVPPPLRARAGRRARAAVLVIAPLLGLGAARTIVANLPGVHRPADCASHGAGSAQCSAGASRNGARR